MLQCPFVARLMHTGAVAQFGLTVFAADGLPPVAISPAKQVGASTFTSLGSRAGPATHVQTRAIRLIDDRLSTDAGFAEYRDDGDAGTRGECANAQPGDIEENEPSGGCAPGYSDQFNGGCFSSPSAFSEISCGDTVHGLSGTFLFGGQQYRDTDWYLVTVGGTGQILTMTVNADFPSLFGFVDPDACDFVGMSYAFGTPCAQSSVTSACLPPGEYVCLVAPSAFSGIPCGVQYRATLSCEACAPPPPPANDHCADAILLDCPSSTTGDNLTATTDYPAPCGAAGNDVWYRWVAEDETATLDTCNLETLMDTVIAAYDGCGERLLGCNDDACGIQSLLTLSGLTVGNTYWASVSGFAGSRGSFFLSLRCSEFPPFSCAELQPGDIEEYEPGGCFGELDGGCHADPSEFDPFTCGDTIHGVSGTRNVGGVQYRDTDWFLVTTTQDLIVSLTFVADFPSLFGFVDPVTCTFIGTPGLEAQCVQSSVVSECLPPGDYVCFVAPSTFSGIPCGVQYRATLACEPCGSPCPCTGDLEGDGAVSISDLALFLSSFGASAPDIPTPCADIDGDGSVGIGDLSPLLAAFGTDC